MVAKQYFSIDLTGSLTEQVNYKSEKLLFEQPQTRHFT